MTPLFYALLYGFSVSAVIRFSHIQYDPNNRGPKMMQRHTIQSLMIIALLALVALAQAPTASAAPTAPFTPPGENIALHKPYTLAPAPNYRYCTDSADRVQLTDGQYSKGHFWTQTGTVGWQKAKPALITIDLGRVEPIRGASFNTAAGRAGAHFPQAIMIIVSDDNKTFHLAGDLISLSAAKNGRPSETEYSVHRYATDALATHGRYVTLAVAPTDYVFVDEIEVYRGEDVFRGEPLPGSPSASALDCFRAANITFGVQRRLRSDVKSVYNVLYKNPRLAVGMSQFWYDSLRKLESNIDQPPSMPLSSESRFIFPLNTLHRKLFEHQALIWAYVQESTSDGVFPCVVWQSDPWEPLNHIHACPETSTASLKLALMQNETRAATFNLSNASFEQFKGLRTLNVNIKILGLPGGLNPDWIKVHEAQWTDTATSHAVASALPLARRNQDGYTVELIPGITRQIWLTVHPRDIPAGTYHGRIVMQNEHEYIPDLPLEIRVSPIRFPDQPTLHLGGWDYTDVDNKYDVTEQNRDALIAHLREHFVDSPWGTNATIPHGKHATDGRMTVPPDTTVFDRWLQRWPGARQYLIHASVPANFDKFKPATPEFDRAVHDWIAFWANHAQKRGLQPSQLAILLVDEPRKPEYDAVLIPWAKAVRAANTGVRLFEDPTHSDPAKADPRVFALSDVVCPNRTMFQTNPAYRDFYSRRLPPQAELAFYSCSGPATLLDPYAYYRLQAWECWRRGAKGMYFWAFGDAGHGSSWNEYAAHGVTYTPLFLDAKIVTAGKAMEAIREGVEDYEYFVMLKQAVEKAEKKGRSDAAMKKAKDLLENGAARVLDAPGASQPHWSAAKDRALADQVRLEILDALEALN